MIPNEATRVQVDAADPGHSTWLSANAGSGKTRVLTDRVARLLLRGTRPQDVLCLTYTKAAASEMQNRLFRTLGRWAMMPDDDLRDALAAIGEDGQGDLDAARTLFARAIETPGGLRIQTIHSFCASVVRQFPVEAGVTPDFHELDADEAATLLQDVIEDMAQARHPALLAFLALHDGDALGGVVQAVVAARTRFAAAPDPATLGLALGIDGDLDETALCQGLIDMIDPDWWSELQAALSGTNPTNDRTAARMAATDPRHFQPTDATWIEALFANSTNDNSKAGRWPAKPLRAKLAGWIDAIDAFLDAVIDHRLARRAITCRDRTAALHAFATALLTRYAALKQARGVLDFDDLIERTSALLTDATRDWVRYRLDGRIEHILVDEAQDTSPDQWRVIEALAGEIAAGEGAGSRPRSLFVVGDRKQSIYSFQGADAEAFDAMRGHFARRLADSPAPLVERELQFSFRSSAAVLTAADAVLDHLSDAPRTEGRHRAFFDTLPGRVDLWPAVPPPDKPEAVAWFDPVDRPFEEAAQVRLADAVAHEIKRLIDEEAIPQSDGGTRPVRPGDILVLVQRRNVIFDRIIRTAQGLGVDIAGPDRLRLMEEVAVKDLLAILRFLALPDDDLSLAEALRSPILGLDEAGLYTLAQGRGGRSLWRALLARRAEFAAAHGILSDLLAQADFLRPYDLIERILVRHDGRRALVARLGPDAEDAIDEFIALAIRFEDSAIPDLTAFLAHVETLETDVKRSAEGAGRKVRVMTVHGAKGLEAPIVILPDTIRASRADGSALFFDEDGTPFLKSVSTDAPALQADSRARKALAERAEAERLLYVAMTRAESWLIVCGAETRVPGGFWHEAISEALTDLPGTAPLTTPFGPGLRLSHGDWPLREGDAATPDDAAAPTTGLDPLPDPMRPPAPLNPSDLGGAKSLGPGLGDDDPKTWGTAMHLMLELLPGHPAAERADRAARILANADIPEDMVDPLRAADEAGRIIDAHPDLFTATALREVPLAGRLGEVSLAGTVDLMLVEGREVRVVDFKTNAIVPDSAEAVPLAILRQMGAYLAALTLALPDHRITLQILWTTNASLMTLPHAMVREAFEATTIS